MAFASRLLALRSKRTENLSGHLHHARDFLKKNWDDQKSKSPLFISQSCKNPKFHERSLKNIFSIRLKISRSHVLFSRT
jgi:hypothetical protein